MRLDEGIVTKNFKFCECNIWWNRGRPPSVYQNQHSCCWHVVFPRFSCCFSLLPFLPPPPLPPSMRPQCWYKANTDINPAFMECTASGRSRELVEAYKGSCRVWCALTGKNTSSEESGLTPAYNAPRTCSETKDDRAVPLLPFRG